jgi:hypothetical protein
MARSRSQLALLASLALHVCLGAWLTTRRPAAMPAVAEQVSLELVEAPRPAAPPEPAARPQPQPPRSEPVVRRPAKRPHPATAVLQEPPPPAEAQLPSQGGASTGAAAAPSPGGEGLPTAGGLPGAAAGSTPAAIPGPESLPFYDDGPAPLASTYNLSQGRGRTWGPDAEAAATVEAILDEVKTFDSPTVVHDAVFFPGLGQVRADKVCLSSDGRTLRAIARAHTRTICEQEFVDYSGDSRYPVVRCVRGRTETVPENIWEAPVQYWAPTCVEINHADSYHPACIKYGKALKTQFLTYTMDTFDPSDHIHMKPIHHEMKIPTCPGEGGP